MDFPVDKKRNVAIVAHGGAGKTTLAEALLFNAKATDRLGSVDDGSSVLDWEPEERKRRMTVSASVHHYRWNGFQTNVVDTPGYSNFLNETRNALRVTGGAVVLLSAISGVKAQTVKIWEFADEFEVSRIAFVNKMDRERAGFLKAVDDLEKVLGARGVPLQMPMGEGPDFNGVIDLVAMKAYRYAADSSGSFEAGETPARYMEAASKMRADLIEAAVESDDRLTEKYLNDEEITEGELVGAVREAVMTRRFTPVLLGSAARNIGVNLLMDAMNAYLPSPLERGRLRGLVKGKDPATGEEIERRPDPSAPLSAFVFKTTIDPYTGKLSVFRVYSGTVRADSTVLNSGRGVKEKISHLYILEGKKAVEVASAGPGDIAAAAKLKDTFTGDTLSDAAAPVVLPPLAPLHQVISYAVHPRTKADEDKVPGALAKLMEEDPSLDFRRDEETSEFILSGSGQVHLEVSIERLKRKYGCDVALSAPRIPYKETIRKHVKVQGRYKKQSGGHGQYGDAWLEMEPLKRGSGFEFVDAIRGGAIPRQYIPAVEKGVREAMRSGVLAGFPVVDVRVTLFDGSSHSVDSSEMAFKIAASMGFKKGAEEADPVILEPFMTLEISVPEESLGAVMGDINSRRGRILGAEPKAGSHVIHAELPLSEAVGYSNDLKSMTGDRGIFTMEFSRYEEAPTYLGQKIIEAARAEREAKEKGKG